jgi:hypothetical protein
LQKSIKGIVNGNFEFRSTKNGTRVLKKEMADFSAIKSFFLSKKLSFYTYIPKSQKPIKAVIRHLPPNTPAEEICEALVELSFDTISVRQRTSTRRSPSQDPKHTNLPLYLVTFPRTENSQDIVKLTGLCHISIKVEAYRNQNGLTQCYNSQKFSPVWVNCSQPPRCMWCGGGHLHKDCPEIENESSTPSCCNCKLLDGEKLLPSNYRGCSHAREEIRRRRTQKTYGVSFAPALRNNSDHNRSLLQARL